MSPYVVQPVEPKAIMFLLLLVAWWLIRHQPEESTTEEDGGTHTPPRQPHPHRPRPGGQLPQTPRRGPHGDPAPASPRRVRTAARPVRVRPGH